MDIIAAQVTLAITLGAQVELLIKCRVPPELDASALAGLTAILLALFFLPLSLSLARLDQALLNHSVKPDLITLEIKDTSATMTEPASSSAPET